MELWSKGLGKRVLSLRLRERERVTEKDGVFVIEGVMHAPVFWDYTVSLGEADVVDFLELLKKPESVKFLVRSRGRGTILWTALSSALIFLVRTLRLLLGAAGLAAAPRVAPETEPDGIETETKGPVS
jgi:hypothetical protein